ncbi:hypothetical protein [Streptomyces sp. MZ04]|uniref:hypothetical protein n=1 Tax=Streptomyces sp. MZ04 TaxID=2559236 RepID=UPI0032AFC66A
MLIVITAGVLGYGLRDLQKGGALPGGTSYAVDLGGSVDAGSWCSTLVQGVFNLTPTMTWLQVTAYVGYVAVVMSLFVRGVRAPVARPTAPESRRAAQAGASTGTVPPGWCPSRWSPYPRSSLGSWSPSATPSPPPGQLQWSGAVRPNDDA